MNTHSFISIAAFSKIMDSGIPFHKGLLIQKGRGIGGIFSSLFRTLLPIGKALVKSSPRILKAASKSNVGKRIKKSAKKIALNTAKNLIQSGNINKTLSKTVEDSKKEIADALIQSKNQRKRIKTSQKYCKPNKIRKYHLVK